MPASAPMSHVHAFTAEIRSTGRGTYVVVPFDVEAAFGRKRPPVRATLDGHEYRGSLVRMRGAEHWLAVVKVVQEAIGRGPGATVDVTVALDTAPRTIDVPADLAAALAEAGLRETFSALAFTHRKEYVRWIDEAKRDATRARRVAGTVERLQLG